METPHPGASGVSALSDVVDRSLLNPDALYVDGNYALRLNAWCSVAGVTIGLRYRFLRALDGQVVDSVEQLAPTSNRVLTTTDFQLSRGWPLTIEVFALAGTPTIGQCFVQVQLVRGRGGASLATATLIQSYITASNARAWPGSLLESSLDGAGALRSITGTNPGAGVEITETVPAGARWELLAFKTLYTTSVAAANRFPALVVDDGALVYGQFQNQNAIPASQADTLTWAPGAGQPSGAVNITQVMSTPVGLRQGPGHRMRTSTSGKDAADTYTLIQYLVREWLTAD